ncbi:MAG: lysophospholipid acyltransferase family protein [Saprospiraceae bacterium]|nr:lysophospholipid acyltransferase family protein [Saprospiraceae bacterium]
MRLNTLRGVYRGIGVGLIIAVHLVPIIIGVVVFKKKLAWTLRQRQRIARHLVWFINIKIRQSGTPQDGNFLFIGNHRSYADPIIAAVAVAFLPVAKAEVEKWPLIGWGARITGVLYVKRESKQSRVDARMAIREGLKAGDPVLIYPEGTTSADPLTLPFRVSAFQVAAELRVPVVPITLYYGDPEDNWSGQESFVAHFLQTFSKPEMNVWIDFGKPILDGNWETLLAKTQTAINEKIVELRPK